MKREKNKRKIRAKGSVNLFCSCRKIRKVAGYKSWNDDIQDFHGRDFRGMDMKPVFEGATFGQDGLLSNTEIVFGRGWRQSGREGAHLGFEFSMDISDCSGYLKGPCKTGGDCPKGFSPEPNRADPQYVK